MRSFVEASGEEGPPTRHKTACAQGTMEASSDHSCRASEDLGIENSPRVDANPRAAPEPSTAATASSTTTRQLRQRGLSTNLGSSNGTGSRGTPRSRRRHHSLFQCRWSVGATVLLFMAGAVSSTKAKETAAHGLLRVSAQSSATWQGLESQLHQDSPVRNLPRKSLIQLSKLLQSTAPSSPPCTPPTPCPGTLAPNSYLFADSGKAVCNCSSPLLVLLSLDETAAGSKLPSPLMEPMSQGLAAGLGLASPTQVWVAALVGVQGTVQNATVWIFPTSALAWSTVDVSVMVSKMLFNSSILGIPGVKSTLVNAVVGAATSAPAQDSTYFAPGAPTAPSLPPPSVPQQQTGVPGTSSNSTDASAGGASSTPAWAIAVIAVLGALFLGAAALAGFLFLRMHSMGTTEGVGPSIMRIESKSLMSKRAAPDAGNGKADEGVGAEAPQPPPPKPKPATSEFSVKVAENFVKALTLDDLIASTSNFSDSNTLGSGGYGTVYKGIGPGGVLWAVKRAKNASHEGIEDFQNEVDVISKMSHRNLVKLLGYCDERGEQILVYEFVPNGTLRQHIRPDNPTFAPLTFQQRLEIAVGSAEGLKYLHSAAEPAIIHRDIKCDNILLDHDMQAKVADFGVFKKSPTEGGKTMNTRVVGTPGYVDPEYYQTYKVTTKSDVYSFGVVLLELITGRPPIMEDPSVENESYMVTLSRWATPKIAAGKVETIVDPRLHGTYPRQALNMMAAITAMCVRRLGRDRPEMAEVATRLAEIKYFLKPSSGILEPVMNLFPEDRDDNDNLNEIPEEEDDFQAPENIPGIAGVNPYSTSDIAAPVSMVFSDR